MITIMASKSFTSALVARVVPIRPASVENPAPPAACTRVPNLGKTLRPGGAGRSAQVLAGPARQLNDSHGMSHSLVRTRLVASGLLLVALVAGGALSATGQAPRASADRGGRFL